SALGGARGEDSPPDEPGTATRGRTQLVDYTVAGVEGGLCAPRGFRAAGVDAGLTRGTGPDLGLVVSQQTSAAAGRFTAHPFASAPRRSPRGPPRSATAR